MLESSGLAEFECAISPGYDMTKKLWLLIILARRLSDQPGLGRLTKICELPLFFAAIGRATRGWKARSRKL